MGDQDVLNCLVLSEAAYRVLDQGPAQVPRILTERKQQFPTGLITLQSVQTSLPHVQHRSPCHLLTCYRPACRAYAYSLLHSSIFVLLNGTLRSALVICPGLSHCKHPARARAHPHHTLTQNNTHLHNG